MTQNILIVDDHSIVRAGIEILLSDKVDNPFFYETDCFEKCLYFVSNYAIDLVILDINLPDGLKTMMITKIRTINPDQKILIFSAHEEDEVKIKYIKAGVNGFVSKLEDEQKFIDAVIEVLNSGNCISNDLLSRANDMSFIEIKDKLSSRENEVANLMIQGYGNLEISNELSLKMSTVSTYKNRIFEKLNISNVIELVAIFNN
ncbi:response regulator transcription factor [Flavobacterium sp. N2820]|jgi:DNA-binding NarL/FixJ family response regulator|uniref:response regulator n=1 Tax=Flavobacterium sp. N2820 TaxID=2986834 RepID=UPI002225308D|nr:response regulator transcription factor [Flavobacterium sp. N2820]